MIPIRTIPPRTTSLRLLPRALSLALCACACAAMPALVGAQVTYFQRPPTPEQLRAALLAPTAQPAAGAVYASGNRTRGIVWQTTGTNAAGSTPASASTPLPSATAPPQTPDPTGSTLQAGMVNAASRANSANLGNPVNPVNPITPAAALPINFDLGSSRVERSSLPYLDSIASVMRTDRSIQLIIEGHTDDRGSYNRNMVLSWDRALGVFRTLVETYGIDPRRLQPLGKGPLEPMPGTDPGDGANRRVQFRVSS